MNFIVLTAFKNSTRLVFLDYKLFGCGFVLSHPIVIAADGDNFLDHSNTGSLSGTFEINF